MPAATDDAVDAHPAGPPSDDPNDASIPWKLALVVGVGVFVLGLAVVTGLFVLEASLGNELLEEQEEMDDEEFADAAPEDPGFLTTMGWLYFGVQFVDVEVESVLGTLPFNFYDQLAASATVPGVVWRAVPPVLLLAGGYLLAMRRVAETAPPAVGAKVGASVAVGYLAAVLVAVSACTFETAVVGQELTYRPAFGDAVAFAGIAYPMVFGALGGYLASRR